MRLYSSPYAEPFVLTRRDCDLLRRANSRLLVSAYAIDEEGEVPAVRPVGEYLRRREGDVRARLTFSCARSRSTSLSDFPLSYGGEDESGRVMWWISADWNLSDGDLPPRLHDALIGVASTGVKIWRAELTLYLETTGDCTLLWFLAEETSALAAIGARIVCVPTFTPENSLGPTAGREEDENGWR